MSRGESMVPFPAIIARRGSTVVRPPVAPPPVDATVLDSITFFVDGPGSPLVDDGPVEFGFSTGAPLHRVGDINTYGIGHFQVNGAVGPTFTKTGWYLMLGRVTFLFFATSGKAHVHLVRAVRDTGAPTPSGWPLSVVEDHFEADPPPNRRSMSMQEIIRVEQEAVDNRHVLGLNVRFADDHQASKIIESAHLTVMKIA